jgi:hypothetical protein
MNRIIIVVGVCLSIVAIVYLAKRWAENVCEAKGGILIQTATKYKCVDLREIK